MQVLIKQAQRFQPRRGLKQGLLFRHIEAEHRADEIRDPQWIALLGNDLLQIGRRLRSRKLNNAPHHVENAAEQRLYFGPRVVGPGQHLHPRQQIWLRALQFEQTDTLHTLHEDFHAALRARQFANDCERADRIQVFQGGRLLLLGVALGDNDQRFVIACRRRFHSRHRTGPTRRQRRKRRGKDYRIA
ncbi:hypothetical protein HRbin36_02394 [bacterium HR36]|nr:hypothetical protein HRbin36_02394 [bacterium HR36]